MDCDDSGASLQLSHPDATRPVELGWDDLTHRHPHALRRSGADLLCRTVALADPADGHPGPHLAFLGRFAPICTEADAGHDPYPGDPDARDYLAGDLYSMRVPDEPDFPFAHWPQWWTGHAPLRERPWAVEVPVEAFGGRPHTTGRFAVPA